MSYCDEHGTSDYCSECNDEEWEKKVAKLEKELEEARALLGLEKGWSHNDGNVIESFSKVLEKRNKTLDEFKKYVQFFCDDGDTALIKGGNYRSIIIGYQSLFREMLGELDKPSKGGE